MRNKELRHRPLSNNVWVFPRGADWWVAKNFNVGEFDSDDDHATNHFTLIDMTLVDVLQQIREYVQIPLTVSSGYRTIKENTRIGGAAESYHTLGMAADIHGSTKMGVKELYGVILSLLNSEPPRNHLTAIGGLGFYPKRGIVHIDVRPHNDGVVMWTDENSYDQQA